VGLLAPRPTPILEDLAATRSPCSIKSFLQSLQLLHCLKSDPTNSSCSFMTFGNTVNGISSCFVCPPRLNNWHSLPLQVYLKPTFLAAPCYSNVTIHWNEIWCSPGDWIWCILGLSAGSNDCNQTSTLRTRTEMVFETLVFSPLNHLSRLIARENFT
jgi:hypothetical protein